MPGLLKPVSIDERLSQETLAEWAILIIGKCWRLYFAEASHKIDSYYGSDLNPLFEDDGLKTFTYSYDFFRASVFVDDNGGESFLDRM